LTIRISWLRHSSCTFPFGILKKLRAGYPVFEAYVGQSTIQQFAPGIEKELVIKFDDIHVILP
jgi:hypothetical protein